MSIPKAFMAYCREDNRANVNWIHQAHQQFLDEIRSVTGEDSFDVRIDRDLEWGQNWRRTLSEDISASVFLIPFVTPLFLKSAECRREVLQFEEIERERGRDDLKVRGHRRSHALQEAVRCGEVIEALDDALTVPSNVFIQFAKHRAECWKANRINCVE